VSSATTDQLWGYLGQTLVTGWDLHPTLLASIGGMAVIYVAGVVKGRQRGYRLTLRQGLASAAAIVTLFLTLQSPLHHLADTDFFSAHMLQHLLLTLVAPPLILIGTPEWMLRPVASHRWLARFGHSSAYPIVAFAAFNILFAYAHLPSIYDALFGSELAHRVTHIVFLFTAVATWLPMLSPVPEVLPRLSQPGQMLYAFIQSIPGVLVGSLLALADKPLYKHYGVAAEQFGVAPIADQQLGGLLMWVIGGTYWLVILTVIFFVWADREQQHAYE